MSSLSIYLCTLSALSLFDFSLISYSFASFCIFSPFYSQLSTLSLPSLSQFIYFLSSLLVLLYSIYTLPLSIIASCLGPFYFLDLEECQILVQIFFQNSYRQYNLYKNLAFRRAHSCIVKNKFSERGNMKIHFR